MADESSLPTSTNEARPDAVANRSLRAYEAGRLLNELNWHLQFCLFWSRREDGNDADSVLDRLAAISYAFVNSPQNETAERLLGLRRKWREQILSEQAADDFNALTEEANQLHCDVPNDVLRERLVAAWVSPLLEEARAAILSEMNQPEEWMLELGKLVDQAVHRPDVCRFMEKPREFVKPGKITAKLLRKKPHAPDISPLVNHRPRVGELPVDTAWRPSLQAFAANRGIVLASDCDLLPRPNTEILRQLDHEIRDHLTALSDLRYEHRIPSDLKQKHADKLTVSPDSAGSTLCSEPAGTTSIPVESKTKVLTKAEAARLHAGRRMANPTMYFKKLIEKGMVKPPTGGGHRWQFDVTDFPASAHDRLR